MCTLFFHASVRILMSLIPHFRGTKRGLSGTENPCVAGSIPALPNSVKIGVSVAKINIHHTLALPEDAWINNPCVAGSVPALLIEEPPPKETRKMPCF
jgi:hypothetical protein